MDMIGYIFLTVCFLLLLSWLPLFIPLLRFWFKYANKTGRLAPLVPFALPFFGHSLQLYPHSNQKAFVRRNHDKYGNAFGFFLQDKLCFCLDVATYGPQVHSSPKIQRSSLPPSVAPLKGEAERGIFTPFIRQEYTKQLKLRLSFIRRQLEAFLDAEFPDNNKVYNLDVHSTFQRLSSCYNLAAWCDLEFSQMVKDSSIQKLCDYFHHQTRLQTACAVLPRFSFLASLFLNSHRKAMENVIVPLLRDQKEDKTEGAKSLLQMMNFRVCENTPFTSDDQVVDYMLKFLPTAMSISAHMEPLLPRILSDPKFLFKIKKEQRDISEQHKKDSVSTCLDKMEYLDASIKEELRIEFGLASYRYVAEDLILNNGVVLPAGSNVILTGSAINFDENLFPNSHTWNPQRWIDLNATEKELEFSQRRDAFIWGSGRFVCPGRTHATLGMKLILSLFFSRYSCCYTDEGQFTIQVCQ